MGTRSRMLFVSLIAIAVLGAGCGGGEDEATGAPTLNRAEFLEQANAACRKERVGLSKRVAAWLAQDRRRGYPPEARYWRVAHYVLVPAIENENERVLALVARAPVADRPGLEASVGAEQLALSKIQSKPVQKLESLQAFHRYFAESAVELQANGLDACRNDR